MNSSSWLCWSLDSTNTLASASDRVGGEDVHGIVVALDETLEMGQCAVEVGRFFFEVALEVRPLDLDPWILHAVVDIDPQHDIQTGLGIGKHALHQGVLLDFLGAFEITNGAGTRGVERGKVRDQGRVGDGEIKRFLSCG